MVITIIRPTARHRHSRRRTLSERRGLARGTAESVKNPAKKLSPCATLLYPRWGWAPCSSGIERGDTLDGSCTR